MKKHALICMIVFCFLLLSSTMAASAASAGQNASLTNETLSSSETQKDKTAPAGTLKFDWLEDVTRPMLKYVLIFLAAGVVGIIVYCIQCKAEGRPIRDEKDKPVERLAGLAVFLMAVRFILIILFFPFFIIWKGVGAKKG